MANQTFNISLPDGVNAIDNPLTGGDRITLPFEAVFLNWHNGEARIKPEVGCGVLHFGGWWASAEEVESLSGPLPEKFVPETWTNKEGLDYGAYATRSVLVAVIASRFRWIAKSDDDGNGQGGKGARSHKQVLAYMAYSEPDKKGKKLILPWGPVVLNVKGMVGPELDKAFKAHEKGIAEVRKEIAASVPWPYFYAILGTFGDQRVQKMVGKTQQSPITPPLAYVPDKLDAATLATLYVGEEIAGRMGELREEAAEWLADWKAPAKPAAQVADEYPEQPPEYVDNSVPF